MLPYCQLPQHSQNKGTDSGQFCKLQTKPQTSQTGFFILQRVADFSLKYEEWHCYM